MDIRRASRGDRLNTHEVVVIGGGIVGCAVAYYLASGGLTDVVVVEGKHHGAGATGGSFGGIRQQFKDPLEIEFSRRGLAFWKTAEENLDAPCPFHDSGYLLLTGDVDTAQTLHDSAEVQRSVGMDEVHLLGPDQLNELVPWLVTDGLLVGSWTPGDGHVLPMDGLFAFVKAARTLGVSFHENWPVQAIRRSGSMWQVEGPETIEAEHVVVAAGGGIKNLLTPFGIDLDIRPIEHYSVFTESAFVGQHVPMMIDLDNGLAVQREGRDALHLGVLSMNPPATSHQELMEQFYQVAEVRAPALNLLRIVKNILAYPLIGGDDMPYVGKVDDGLWGIAFTGHGAMHGPPLAEVLAKEILGTPDPIDISAWDLRRETGEPTVLWRRNRPRSVQD